MAVAVSAMHGLVTAKYRYVDAFRRWPTEGAYTCANDHGGMRVDRANEQEGDVMRTSNHEGEEGYKIHRGLFLPVFLSAGAMYLLSYIWHAMVLNDLNDLAVNRTPYLLMSGLGYVLLAVLLTFLGRYLIDAGVVDKNDPSIANAMLMGLVVGIMLGIALHAMSLPLRGRFDTVHMLVDLGWQVVEQAIGGACAGIGIFFHQVRLRLEREGAL